jgi:gliding motility-associated-like protein
MKPLLKIFFSILFFSAKVISFAQTNLVPNYSFEDTLNCPTGATQINNAPPWFTVSNNGSPDYFNACSNSAFVDVPLNFAGYQFAKTGQAYSGMAVFTKNFALREYISIKLFDSLIVNKKYCVEFYISLSDSCSYAISSIGAYFSNDSIKDTNLVLPYTPQVYNPNYNIITDTQNWSKISGYFIAMGGETFMTIGNFNSNANTDTTFLGGNNLFAYYFIDDVSVYECDSVPHPELPFYVPNAFSPNGDGENDLFFVQGNLDELHCYIYNRWGEQISVLDLPKREWDGRANGLACNTGVYFYYLTAKDKNGKEISKKGNITLLR